VPELAKPTGDRISALHICATASVSDLIMRTTCVLVVAALSVARLPFLWRRPC